MLNRDYPPHLSPAACTPCSQPARAHSLPYTLSWSPVRPLSCLHSLQVQSACPRALFTLLHSMLVTSPPSQLPTLPTVSPPARTLYPPTLYTGYQSTCSAACTTSHLLLLIYCTCMHSTCVRDNYFYPPYRSSACTSILIFINYIITLLYFLSSPPHCTVITNSTILVIINLKCILLIPGIPSCEHEIYFLFRIHVVELLHTIFIVVIYNKINSILQF